jgi:hypothetical protein
MTFLEVINAVLRRLREDEVTSSGESAYSKLIGDLVNHANNECERAWNWSHLIDDGGFITEAGKSVYDINDFPGYERKNLAEVQILSAINETKKWHMRKITRDYMLQLEWLGPLQPGSPFFYCIYDIAFDGVLQIKFAPEPTAVEVIRTLKLRYTEQYKTDGSEDSSPIKIPPLPVVLTAYAKAVAERGEDGGTLSLRADAEASTALADAISVDQLHAHLSENSWHVV